jgi:hypothetical protein
MGYDITDYDELQIYVTDGWREWYIPKFRIFMTVDGDFTNLYWTDTEKGASGLTRLLSLDYNDVTFGYIAPSSAGEVVLQIESYIVSAWTDIPTPPPFDPTQTVKQETGDYTLAAGDEFNFIEFTDSGTALEVTVPANATEAFPIGTWVDLFADTSELVDIVEDTGVTINSLQGYKTLNGEFAQARIIKVGTDEWDLFGDLKLTVDPDAAAYIAAYESASGTLTDAQKGYINTLVAGLKADGLWSKLNAFYPMLGTTADMQKWNLIDPQDTNAAFRLTFTGSPTYAMTGITFNGTTQFANTHLAPASVLTQDSTHIGAVSRNDLNTGIQLYVQNAATTTLGLIMRLAGSGFSDHYNQSTNRVTIAQANSIGHYIASRTTSIVHKYFKAGSQIGTTNTNASVSFAGLAALTIYIGARNQNGTANSFCANELNCVHIGSGLSDADVSALTSRVATFNSNFSR